MLVYAGGCHCGAVRFEAEIDLRIVSECNCSICTKKGALHHRVQKFRLLSGERILTMYQFGKRRAKHWFCSLCGIHPFTNPRAAPDKTSINLRCLDDFDQLITRLEIRSFDGRNWEKSVKSFDFE